MKILVFSWRDINHPESGGSELNIHKLSESWIKENNTVYMITSRYKGSSFFEKSEEGINIYRIGNRYTCYILAPFLFFYLRIIKRIVFDIIIDIENGIPFFTPLYSRIPKILYIHHVHLDQFFQFFRFPMNYIGYIMEKYLLKLVYRNSKVVTVSESSREDIIDRLLIKTPIDIVYNGVDLSVYKKTSAKTDYPSFVTVGRLITHKNFDKVIHAFRAVVAKVPEAKLFIIGKGPEEKVLVNLSNELGLGNSVKFLGFVSNELKVETLSKAWAFIAFSDWEGWGLTSIEAQACNTMSVVSKVKGLKETVLNGETGFIVPHDSIKDLTECMVKISKDVKYAEEIGKSSRKFAKSFSWENSASKYLSIISNFLK